MNARFLLIALALLAAARALSASEERGRSLYRNGLRADGTPLAATTGDAAVPLPKAFVACAQCHGHDARGKTEAGITASDIRWETLSRPYELALPGGRRRGPYDAARFLAAVSEGKSSSGAPLDPAMPRYRLSAEEAADLLAYLQQIDHAIGEGVTEDALRIGLALPAVDGHSPLANPDRELLTGWFAEVNRKGGVFRRRIELVSLDSGSTAAAAPVLAVLTGDRGDAGMVPEDSSVEKSRVPVLRTVAPPHGKTSRYAFALYPSAVERAGALIRYATARDQSPQPRLAVIYGAKSGPSTLCDAIVASLPPPAKPILAPFDPNNPDETARTLGSAGVGSALLLGTPADFAPLFASARRLGWDPLFLLLAPSDQRVPDVRAVGTQPAIAGDFSSEALADHRRLGGSATPEPDGTRQLRLLASARFLVAALENAGREINREKLIATLEALREFRSGFSPPGGFNPRRHTAIAGTYVVPLPDSRHLLPVEWVTFD